MTGQRFLLVARDLAVRKTREIIVPLVVLARMIDAEHEVLPFGITTHRGTVGSRFAASVPLAFRRRGLGRTSTLSADPDAVKIFGIQFHIDDYGALQVCEQGLTGMIQAAYPVSTSNATMQIATTEICDRTRYPRS
jgi:hypothetical protein